MADRWLASSNGEPKGPPCERCGSNRSERWRNTLEQVICVDQRRCQERQRKAVAAK